MNNRLFKAMSKCMAFIMLCTMMGTSSVMAQEEFEKEETEQEYQISVPDEPGEYVIMTSDDIVKGADAVVESDEGSIFVTDNKKTRSDPDAVVEKNIEFEGCGGGRRAKAGPVYRDWNLDMINARKLNPGKGKSKKDTVKIAVLDSGVDFIMSDANITKTVNLVETEQDQENMLNDMTGHGTSAAGIISSIDPDAEIYSVRVLDNDNKGTLSRVVAGIYWCIENNVDIINMSFGTGKHSDILQKAVEDAQGNGIIMISAAGNDPSRDVEYPARFKEVAAVGAVDYNGSLSEYNAAGSGAEILAPGEDVPAQSMLGMYTVVSGTSAAAPHVTAVAGILLEKDKSKDGSFIRGLLAASSNRTKTEEGEAGIIDLEYAEDMYDEFEEEGARAVPENVDVLDTASEGEIKASWGTLKDGSNGHEKLVTLGRKDADVTLTNEEIRAIKRGAVYPDKADLDHNCFHGRRCSNWIAPYKYITVIAKRLASNYNSLTYPGEREVFPKGSFSTQINMIKKTIRYDSVFYDKDGANKYLDWSHSRILGDCNYAAYKQNNDKAKMARLKSLFVYGLALHDLTDTYAHATFVKRDGTYKKIVHEHDVMTKAQRASVGPYIIGADDPSVVSERWADARNAASKLIAKAAAKESGVIKDFAPSVTTSTRGYYLHRPIEKAYQIESSETYKRVFKYIDYASFK